MIGVTTPLSAVAERWPRLRGSADHWAAGAAVALGVSIPVSVSADAALTAAVLVLSAIGGRYRDKLASAWANPVARAAALLLGLLALGLLWGVRGPGDGMRYFSRYLDLGLIAVLVPLFREAALRRAALIGFGAAMAVTLILSDALYLGLISHIPGLMANTADRAVFRSTITQNILMAFAAFLFALAARTAPAPWRRGLLGLLAVLAAHNALFVVSGRTGYAVLGVLLVYLAVAWGGWRGLAVGGTVLAALVATAFLTSATFHQRLAIAVEQATAWDPGRPAATSIGLRLEFYRNTAGIIADHPVLGVGTGGFPHAYAERVAGTGAEPTQNPHNEYLMVTAQVGPFGLVLLLALFGLEWRMARRLPSAAERHLARGLMLTLAAGCLFNTLLLDHTEGLFHAWMAGVLFAGLAPPEPRTEGGR